MIYAFITIFNIIYYGITQRKDYSYVTIQCTFRIWLITRIFGTK
jgi:hypothetical protein